MPTYEYQCSACGHNFEQVQKISENALIDCPKCGKPDLKRLVNAAAFHLKGSGWYKTDYASNSSSATTSTTTKTSTTTDTSTTKSETPSAPSTGSSSNSGE